MPGKDDLDNLQTQVVRGGHRQNSDEEATRLVRPGEGPAQPVRVAGAPLDAIPDTRRPAMAPLSTLPGSAPAVGSEAVVAAAQLNASPAAPPRSAIQPQNAPDIAGDAMMAKDAMMQSDAAKDAMMAGTSTMAAEPMPMPGQAMAKDAMADPEATRLVPDQPTDATPTGAGGSMAMASAGMDETPTMSGKPAGEATMAGHAMAEGVMPKDMMAGDAMSGEAMAGAAMADAKPFPMMPAAAMMPDRSAMQDQPAMHEQPMMHETPMTDAAMMPEKPAMDGPVADQPMLVASEAPRADDQGTMIASEPPTRSDPAEKPMEPGVAPPSPKPLEPPRERPSYVEGSATRIVGVGGGTQPAPNLPTHGFDPVVGWVVVVDGPGRGNARAVHSGMNALGRDRANRIPLDFGDQSISRDQHAFIAYDERENTFFFNHGGKKNLIRLDGQIVVGATPLKDGAKIEIGATTLKFVAFCGPGFAWGGMG